MTLSLPRLRVGIEGGEPRVVADDPRILTPTLEALLVAMAEELPPQNAVSDCFLPLSQEQWLVGRRWGEQSVWRVVGQADYQRIGHPSWLWTEAGWFDPVGGRAPTPVVLPLRHVLRNAAPFSGSHRRTCQSLAAVVAALRRREGAVAVVVPRAAFTCADDRNLWFMVALLTMLPQSWRSEVWVSTFESAPRSDSWDLVLTDRAPEDFLVVDGLAPQTEAHEDLVAAFLLDRLLANDPEAVEAAAFLFDGEGEDPWEDGVKRHLAAGVPGVSMVDPDMLRDDPEAAVLAVTWRIRAGASVSGAVVRDLARVTARTGDPRPWREMRHCSPEEVTGAIQAWLSQRKLRPPRDDLLQSIGQLEPRGRGLEPLYGALARWLEREEVDSAAAEVLRDIYVANSALLDSGSAASMCVEVVRLLVRAGRSLQARDLVLGRVGKRLAVAGVPAALSYAWLSLPTEARPPAALLELIDLVEDSPNGVMAVETLIRGLQFQGSTLDAEAVVRRWVELTVRRDAPLAEDLLEVVRGSSLAVAWAQAAAAFADGNELRRLVLAVVADEGDEVWRAAEEVRSKVVGGTERERLAAMGDLLPEGADVLEPVGRGLLSAALSHAEFPDDELAGVSMAFAQGEDASSLWSLLVITAAAPGEFDDETIDATVVAFCANPPGSRRERMVAAKCVENLALADAWVPLDHARWLVRFIMAPSVDEFHMDLADELIRALAMRNDGPERLAEITHAIVELPMEHPAVGVFVKRLLPRAWMEHVPAEFADAVFTMALEDEVRILLEDALGFRPGG